MTKKGEIFWEVGKQLSKETWEKIWKRNENVGSQEFIMPDICTLQIFFYPAGINSDAPCFKLVRTNTTLRRRRIQGKIQLCHGDTSFFRAFDLDHDFERGKSEFIHSFKDYEDLRTMQIFHSLPELCYRLIYKVLDPDPNETEPEPKPVKDIISSGINYVWSGISYVFGWGPEDIAHYTLQESK